MSKNFKYTPMLIEKSLAEDIKNKYKPEYWKTADASNYNIPTAQDFWFTYITDIADAGMFGEEYEEGKKQLTEKQLIEITSAIMEDDQLWNEIDNEVQNIAPEILKQYKSKSHKNQKPSSKNQMVFVPMLLEVSLANDIKKYHREEYYKDTVIHQEFENLPKTVNFHPTVTAKEFWTQYFKDIADAGMLGEEYEDGNKQLPQEAIDEMIEAIMESDRLWETIDMEVQDIARPILQPKKKLKN